jgi:DNA-directed RNA polymerase subunit RPC12/RpoP
MEDDGERNKALRCPNCGWMDVRRSMLHGMVDHLIRMIGLVPYRCRSCGMRFYRTQKEVPQETTE